MNLFNILEDRRVGGSGVRHRDWNRTQIDPHQSLIRRMALAGVLEGHRGCVNRLAWSSDGSYLASVSDDRQVLLWELHSQKQIHAIPSGHSQNIFGVQFIPGTCNQRIATGAMDFEVRLHAIADMNQNHHSSSNKTVEFLCHVDRIKDIQTSQHDPFMFWSVSEDGTSRQFDLREKHSCKCDGKCSNVFVDFRQPTIIELKGFSFNPIHPMFVVFACGDQFVRVIDRRIIRKDSSGSSECVSEFAPSHLLNRSSSSSSVHSTYVQYSRDGSQILTSYHGEHVYLFDHYGNENSPISFKRVVHRNGFSNGMLSSRANLLKNQGNDAFSAQQFSSAISKYNAAILEASHKAVLYSNRAAAYLKRGWHSDAEMALKDCDTALKFDESHMKSHYRRIQALNALGKHTLAVEAAESAKSMFPDLDDFIRLAEESQEKFREKQETDERVRQRRSEDSFIRISRNRGEFVSRGFRNLFSGSQSRNENPDDNESDEDVMSSESTPNANENKEEKESTENEDHSMETLEESSSSSSSKSSHDTVRRIQNGKIGSRRLRKIARKSDIIQRFVGHCNMQTDIKEATFFGGYIISGSDDGFIYIWNKRTGEIVNIIKASDGHVINCCQPHPTVPILASSGIENVVKLWSPTGLEPSSPTLLESWQDKMSKNQETLARGVAGIQVDASSFFAYIRAVIAAQSPSASSSS
uniref:WD repeat protein iqw1-like n=1 Tax=Hirondellea gigas TaxID=1518452 RepID=A0A6A7FV73_9CRUS